MAEDTLFSKIIRGEIPCDKVYEDEHVFAFRDINPAAPSHILVVPKKVIPRVTDATEEDEALLGKLLLTANKIAEDEGIVEAGARYVININEGGGQTVFHLHLHILGGRTFNWPPG
jgi:histidine triad (HIT) family protein